MTRPLSRCWFSASLGLSPAPPAVGGRGQALLSRVPVVILLFKTILFSCIYSSGWTLKSVLELPMCEFCRLIRTSLHCPFSFHKCLVFIPGKLCSQYGVVRVHAWSGPTGTLTALSSHLSVLRVSSLIYIFLHHFNMFTFFIFILILIVTTKIQRVIEKRFVFV